MIKFNLTLYEPSNTGSFAHTQERSRREEIFPLRLATFSVPFFHLQMKQSKRSQYPSGSKHECPRCFSDTGWFMDSHFNSPICNKDPHIVIDKGSGMTSFAG